MVGKLAQGRPRGQARGLDVGVGQWAIVVNQGRDAFGLR